MRSASFLGIIESDKNENKTIDGSHLSSRSRTHFWCMLKFISSVGWEPHSMEISMKWKVFQCVKRYDETTNWKPLNSIQHQKKNKNVEKIEFLYTIPIEKKVLLNYLGRERERNNPWLWLEEKEVKSHFFEVKADIVDDMHVAYCCVFPFHFPRSFFFLLKLTSLSLSRYNNVLNGCCYLLFCCPMCFSLMLLTIAR